MYDNFKITVFEYEETDVYDEVSMRNIMCGGDEFV